MKAIIIPGMNDMNKGDQALIWESVRLAEDTGIFSTIKVMSGGDTPEELEALCSQSRSKGIKLVYNILPHPRRGKHLQDFREGLFSRFRLAINAVSDYVSLLFLVKNIDRPVLLSFFFDQNVLHTLREFRETDVVFVKGGGFIHAYGEMAAPYQMWYFLFYLRLAHQLGKKVIVLPNSFGPFEGLAVKNQIKEVLSKTAKVYARERKSSEQLGKLLGQTIEVMPDLGFYLKSNSDKKLSDIIPPHLFEKGHLKVGFTVRPWRFPGSDKSKILYQKYLESVSSLVEAVTHQGDLAIFFNQSVGPNTHEDDRIAIAEMMQRFNNNPSVIWVDENFKCDELQALYGELDLMVGTRFHSVIFSMNSEIPSLAIGYGGNKASGIMGDFELNEYTVPIDDISPDILHKTYHKLKDNRELVKRQIGNMRIELDESRTALINEIKSIVKSHDE